MVCILKISKGPNSVNSIGEVMVLVLSTLSDSVLYLYHVLSKYLIGFRSQGPEQQGHCWGGRNLQRGIIP